MTRSLFGCWLIIISGTITTFAQAQGFNYDESNVPKFDLPDPLVTADGKPVTDEKTWWTVRRPEILRLFETEMYGKSPSPPESITTATREAKSPVLDGLAVRRQEWILFDGRTDGPKMRLLIYIPRSALETKKPVPAFLGLNFGGNHTIHADPDIHLGTLFDRRTGKESPATDEDRGRSSSRWPVEMILKRGYALVTAYYGDIDPDYDDGFQNGIHPLFEKEGQDKPAADEWGSIGAWAFGLSRALDYLEQDPLIDAKRVAVIGHSRLGKTALWAGAQDQRFALVISNNSGCGGAALSRRRFGETVKRINTSFPHWFCDNFNKYNDNEDALPVDQHMLIALIAPRPVYIASAAEDLWADPKGEFLSALHANPVYRLLGTEGLPAKEHPGVDKPVAGTIGYHLRTGKHDVTEYDWQQYLEFADRHLGNKRRDD